MAITDKNIHAIADKLLAEGITPTLALVRKALGGGSFTTISEGMKIWKAKQAEDEALKDIAESAPEGITERLSILGAEVWQVAQSLANERLKSEREALEVARTEYENSAKEAAELADLMSEEAEELKKELNEAKVSIEEEKAKGSNFERLKSDLLEKTNEQIALSIETVKEITKRLNEFETSNKHFIKDNDRLQEENDKLKIIKNQ